jgi:hypothetical protein
MTASLAFTPDLYLEDQEATPTAEPTPQWGNLDQELFAQQFDAVSARVRGVATLNKRGERALKGPAKAVSRQVLAMDGPISSQQELDALCKMVGTQVHRAKSALRAEFQKDAAEELVRAFTDAQAAVQAALYPDAEPDAGPTLLVVQADPLSKRQRRKAAQGAKRNRGGRRQGRR